MKCLQVVGMSFLSCFLISFCASSQFIENKGQVIDLNQDFHPEVKYYHSSSNAAVYFHKNRVVYNFMVIDELDMALYSLDREKYDEVHKKREVTYHRMDLVFENANDDVIINEGEKLPGVTHFYVNKRNGIRDVYSHKTLTYSEIYPNIDVVFQNNKKGMKYDVVLKEGAKIEDVQLKFEGYSIEIKDGKLVILTPFGNITEEIPLSFIDNDKSKEVAVEYVLLDENTVGFKLRDEINYATLTIDPVLEWASYFNQLIDPTSASARLDYISNHVDADGNYFTYGQGFSSAGNYPVVNPGGAYTDVYDNSSDLYLAKFDANRQLVWGTYIGGSGSDNASWGNPILTDGNILHIVGRDISTGAPFTNGGGFYEAVANRNFWARFDKNTGALQHLTSLSQGDHASIAISPSGTVAIVSDMFSSGYIPTLTRGGAYNQAANGGSRDMVLLMFNSSFNQIWGTYLGGPGTQEYFTCAFDSGENLYFAGGTSWFGGSNAATEQLVNLPGAYNQTIHGGANDVMLGKFNPSGQLIWHTLYGGNTDEARAGQMGVPAKVLIDPTTDELILATNTTSDNLPIQTLPGAYNKGLPADPDFGPGGFGGFVNYAGYIAKFTPAGVRNWATYFYSNTNNSGTYIQNIVYGGCNKFYVGAAGAQNTLTGAASGYNLLTSTSASRNGYITMLDASSYGFEWDSYLNSDHALDCYVAANTSQARFFVVAPVWFDNLPVTDPGGGAFYTANTWNASGSTLGIFQFHPSLPPDVTDETICAGESITLTASGGTGAPYNWYATSTSTTVLNTGSSYTVSPGTTTTYYVSSGSGLCISPRVPVTVTVNPAPTPPSLSNNGPLCIGDNLNLTANTISGATYDWTGPNGFSSSSEDPSIVSITAAAAGTYNCTVEVAGCTSTAASTTLTLNTESTAPTSITGTTSICEGASATLTINGGLAGTGANPQWYSGTCGSAVIGTNSSLTVSPTTTTTYLVAYSGTCNTTSCASVTVNVTPAPGSPAWTSPGTVCEVAGTIDLNSTITGASGGTWSGTGVTGSTFDPTGLSGSINVTYTTGTIPCTDDLTQSINVTPQLDPSWTTPGTVCETGGTIDLNATITGNSGGTWSGTGVSGNSFDPTGLSGSIIVTYTVGASPCEEVSPQNITVTPAPGSPAWTSPGTVCEGLGTIDLSTTITGASGGTWSGTGVTGSTFDPVGLSGSINITYTTGTSPCTDDLTQSITVTPQVDPSWTTPGAICETGGTINLDATITGNSGGTWSGTGVSGNSFDPTGLSGNISVTYTVGTSPCEEVSTQDITVTPAPGNPAWTSPGTVCEGAGTIDLNTTITGVSGGTWSGTGVTGSIFDPTGLSGSINITYTTGTSPCTDDLTQAITVTPQADPTWTSPGTICEISGIIDLNATITGSTGGTWSGTGVSGSTFDPTGLAGQSIDVTYTVGTAPCEETLLQTITVETSVTAAWTAPTDVCETDTPIDLTPFVTGSAGGTWSGNGISGSNFDPSGLTGPTTITYTVGAGSCTDTQDQIINVNSAPTDPTVSLDNDTICQDGTVQITASGSGAGVTYNVYSDAQGNNLIGITPLNVSPTTTTNYYVEAVNANNCANAGGLQQVTVTVNPIPSVNAGPDLTICAGETVTLNATGDGTFSWSTGETGATITDVPTAGNNTYTVTVTDSNNCSASDDVTVIVNNPSGTLDAVDDLFSVNSNEISSLDILDNDTYAGTSPTIIQNPMNGIASVQTDGTISYSSSAEFAGSDTLVYEICDPLCVNYCDTAIVVILVSEDDDIVIPGGFTPNGDNINETFVIEGLSEYPNNSLTIFNRWGDVVFEAAPYQNNWDGTPNGKGVLFGDKVPPATYFYILELGDGTNAYRGSLELKY